MNLGSCAAVELLSPEQIRARLAQASVAFLPLGSLEFHGPHLPIGLDALTAHELCLAAAGRVGGVVFPALYHAVGGEHTRYPWTFMSPGPAAIEELLATTLQRLSELDVRRAVLLSGHFADDQGDMIATVATAWNARGSGMRVVARTLGQAPDPPIPPDHAGLFESLTLYAFRPDLVDVGRLPAADTHPAPDGEDPFGADRHRADHPLHGVFGPDPRRMDPSDAPPLADHLIRWIARLATTE